MQQPFTNSEAVKRCLTIPNAPIPGVPSYEPRPPYGTGSGKTVRTRPYSGSFNFPYALSSNFKEIRNDKLCFVSHEN